MEDERRLGFTDMLMLLAVLFWGLNFSMVKIALAHISPHAFNSIRLFVSTLLLFAIVAIRKEGLSLRRGDALRLFALGLVGNFFYQMLFIKGISLTSASNTSLILAMTPTFVALLSTVLRVERISWPGWLGIGISFAGLYLIITQQSGSFRFSGTGWRGDLMILTGNLFWAVYTVFSKPILERMSPLKLTTLTLAAGSFFYILYAIPDIAVLDWSRVPAAAWASLAYSAVFAIVLGYLFWYISVKKVGNSKTAVYGSITPVLTAVFASLFIGERLTAFQAVGAAIILAGVYLTRSGYRLFVRNRIISHTPE